MPWEVMASMEQIVIDGKSSFSRTESITKNINWLSLIIPNDANQVRMQLEKFKETGVIPYSLIQFNPQNDFQNLRYDSSLKWIDEKNHAVISNGPFYLDRYSPDSRMIVIKSFDYGDYLFEQGKWKQFEDVKFPSISSVEFVQPYIIGSDEEIEVRTENSSEIHYFLIDSEGKIIHNGIEEIKNNSGKISLNTELDFAQGANNVKIFAASDQVLKPFEYSKSFIVLKENNDIPQSEILESSRIVENNEWYVLFILPIIVGIIIFGIRKSRLSANNK